MARELTNTLALVAEDDTEMIRARLGGELRDRWKAVLEARKISQQRAIVEMIGWFCDQDPLTQAMIFDQVPGTDHSALSRIVLERLERRK